MADQPLDVDIAHWLRDLEPSDQPTTIAEVRALSRRNNLLAVQRMPSDLLPASETDEMIAGPASPLPIRILRPSASEPAGTVVYFHGGGWTLGGIDTHLGHARRICTQAEMVVVSVGYRLAPEHRFPAAFDDAVAVTESVATRLDELGAPGRLIVAGDSVGGQLAASVALDRRDRGQPLDAQLLLYPVTDVTGRYADPEVNARFWSRGATSSRYGLTLAGMADFARYYVDEADAADWRVSPMRAKSLAGVAPAVIHTATLDVLRTEGNFYGTALHEAGVPVIQREWPTLNHSYFGMGGVSAVANAAAAQAADDLRDLLAGQTRTLL
ncbi:MAG: alpha/beta hydrolase [Actinobacteria bacterium]|nr:alpha/beta hydrolase [Actinomycetota bacterium]